MTVKTGSAQSQEERQTRQDTSRERINLDHRYREIGIEAVAAAVHCAGLGERQTDAPAARQIEQRFIEVAN